MKKIYATVFTILTFAIAGISQPTDRSKLDQYFQVLGKADKFMGSVAISKDRKLIYTTAVGFIDRANKVVANENTKYRIGSISKTFTAVLILKSVEDGKLKLTQTIDMYFPSLKNGSKISISDLLYHRSGIHNFTDSPDYLTWNTQPKSEAEMISIIAKPESDFEPGSKSAYSNSNYVLLSYILTKIYNQPYAAILNSQIVNPLKLTNTHFGEKINVKNNEAYSYRFTTSWSLESETDMSIPMGAGSIISTPADIVLFMEALFNNELISEASLEQMKTLKDRYGMGLFQFPFHESRGFGHTGGIDGFSSVFTYFPETKLAYALVSNGSNFNTNNISIAALSFAYNKSFEIPNFNTLALTSADLDKYLGIYVSKQLPIQIAVSKNNATLMAQATGQSAFSLEATEVDKFKFEAAGVVMEFNPTENQMTLKQGGGVFTFIRQ